MKPERPAARPVAFIHHPTLIRHTHPFTRLPIYSGLSSLEPSLQFYISDLLGYLEISTTTTRHSTCLSSLAASLIPKTGSSRFPRGSGALKSGGLILRFEKFHDL